MEKPPVSEAPPQPDAAQEPLEPPLEPLIADSSLSDDGVRLVSFDDDGLAIIDLAELGFLTDEDPGPGS